MKIAIVSGGTGGHIYPGIALAQEIKNRDSRAEILFLGSTEGLEKELIAEQGFTLKLIKSRALLRKLSYKAISAPFVSLIGFCQSLVILKSFRPKVLISTGGYASLPVVVAAKLLRIPIFIHEQNVLPGAVNRFCQKLASKVFLSFPETLKYLPGEVVGNPVRQDIVKASRSAARKRFNFSDSATAILIVGGSQGSKKINETVISALDNLPLTTHILHIIGNRDFGWVNAFLQGKELKNYRALPYLHNMAEALAAADLVISRAGATAIAEFLVRALPMILIPFPYAAENHQQLNAEVVAGQGAAIIINDRDFTAQKFQEIVGAANQNYDKMRIACRKIVQPEAAARIINYLYA